MTIPNVEFRPFPKIARLRRDVVVTEKIDGTSGTIFISDELNIFAASRTRWVTPTDDNYGFSRWVEENSQALLTLGPGWHRGEFFGRGINRNYGLRERRFVLFNTERWCLHNEVPRSTSRWPTKDNPATETWQQVLPPCVGLVPVLYRGIFDTTTIAGELAELAIRGSKAVPGYHNPEGVVVYHTASGTSFKQTIDGDIPKGATL